MTIPNISDSETLLQSSLAKMSPDMREAFIEVLEWIVQLSQSERAKITPNQIQSLVFKNFALRYQDALIDNVEESG